LPLNDSGMEPKTQASDATEFYLVLTPTLGAHLRASEAIHHRFAALTDEIRNDLAAVVGELVDKAVERRPGRPITVAIALGPDAIHGEVYDRGEIRDPEPTSNARFEIPLAR
jgi:hypothetical protein